jgi:hypothetical protein
MTSWKLGTEVKISVGKPDRKRQLVRWSVSKRDVKIRIKQSARLWIGFIWIHRVLNKDSGRGNILTS